jgi:hypothetical protein
MSIAGFIPYKDWSGAEQMDQIQLVASTTFYLYDAIVVTNGIATQVSAINTKMTHILQSVITPQTLLRPATTAVGVYTTTIAGEMGLLVPVVGAGAPIRFKVYLVGTSVPPISAVACNTNSTTTQVVFANTGAASNDFLPGTVYINTIEQQRTVTASAGTGNVDTLTVAPAFTTGGVGGTAYAPTVGDTVTAVPFCKGSIGTGFKTNGTVLSQAIDTSIANKAGGLLKCEDVFLGPWINWMTGVGTVGPAQQNLPYAVFSAPYLQ